MKAFVRWTPLFLALSVALCSQNSNAPPPRGGKSSEAFDLRKKAEHFIDREDFDSSLAYSRKAVGIAEKEKDWFEWGESQVNILAALYNLGQNAEATAAFPALERSAAAVLAADSSFWGKYFNYAAAIKDDLGNYEEALEYGLREVAFYEKNGPDSAFAVACNNIGYYYLIRGDFDRALEYTQSALQVYLSKLKNHQADLAWTYNNLSAIWYRKKDYPKSVAHSQKALSILEKNFSGKNPSDFIIVYNDLSNAWAEMNEYDKALDVLQKGARLYEKIKSEEDIEVLWQNLGFVYRRTGKYAEAKKYLEKALERHKTLHDSKHPNIGKAYRHLGFVANRQGDLRGALAYYQQALRVLTDSFPHENLLANPAVQRVSSYIDFLFTLRDKGETLRQLAQKEQNPQFLEASLATYDAAMTLLDTMRAEYQEGSRQFWNRETRPIVERAIETALELNASKGEPKYLEQAFRYAEKSKALLLAEALRESAARQKAGIPEALLQEEKDLKIDIAFYKKLIFREQQNADADTSKILLWQKEILRRRRAYEALLAKLETSFPEYYKIKYSQPSLDIAAVQKALPTGCGLLEYFVGDSATYVFYFEKNTAKGLRLPPDPDFNQKLENFVHKLRDRKQVLERGRSKEAIAQFAKEARSFYQKLVANAAEKTPGQLIVIPDGNLSYLPFELLLAQNPERTDNYADLPYLLRQSSVRYEYSTALALQPPVQKNRGQFVGYAPAYTDDGLTTSRGEGDGCRESNATEFAALGNNQTEVSQIAQLLRGQALLGEAATESHFKRHAPESGILHFAMHGFLNDCDPLYSGLVFSKMGIAESRAVGENARGDSGDEADGFLHAYEIYNLSLNAELAVLSACNTGRGQLAKGEGVISLARAFKYAGCANVLMSLWQADDAATAHIMQDFYKNLKKGMGKDEAVRQAKLGYLSASNRNHPFFWGAFVLIGDDRPIARSNAWATWLAWGLLGAATVAAGFYFWKKKKTSIQNH